MRSSSWTVFAAVAVLATPLAAQDWKGRARLDGRVTDHNGAPLSGATITIESLTLNSGPVVTTDARGGWVVDGIAAGSCAVEITAPGYEPQRIGVHLPHESAWLAPLDVQLQRTPAEPAREPAEPSSPSAEPTATEAAVPTSEARSDYLELRAALEAGRVERAHELLASLDENARADAGALVEMGTLFLTAGKTADAVTLFDRAVERDPAHAEAHFRRALALLALGRSREARADFERVLGLSPEGTAAEKARKALEQLSPAAGGETP
jgi:hypothetical protein